MAPSQKSSLPMAEFFLCISNVMFIVWLKPSRVPWGKFLRTGNPPQHKCLCKRWVKHINDDNLSSVGSVTAVHTITIKIYWRQLIGMIIFPDVGWNFICLNHSAVACVLWENDIQITHRQFSVRNYNLTIWYLVSSSSWRPQSKIPQR